MDFPIVGFSYRSTTASGFISHPRREWQMWLRSGPQKRKHMQSLFLPLRKQMRQSMGERQSAFPCRSSRVRSSGNVTC